MNVRGRVSGQLTAAFPRVAAVRLAKTANVQGDINYKTLAIEEEAVIDGQMRRIDPAKAAADANVAILKAPPAGGDAKAAGGGTGGSPSVAPSGAPRPAPSPRPPPRGPRGASQSRASPGRDAGRAPSRAGPQREVEGLWDATRSGRRWSPPATERTALAQESLDDRLGGIDAIIAVIGRFTDDKRADERLSKRYALTDIAALNNFKVPQPEQDELAAIVASLKDKAVGR